MNTSKILPPILDLDSKAISRDAKQFKELAPAEIRAAAKLQHSCAQNLRRIGARKPQPMREVGWRLQSQQPAIRHKRLCLAKAPQAACH